MDNSIKKYYVPESAIEPVLNREMKKFDIIIASVFGGFILLLFILMPARLYSFLLLPLVVLSLLGVLMHFVALPKRRNMILSTEYQIADDHVAKGLNGERLSADNKFGIAVAQARYGDESHNQFIRVDEIETTEIGETAITIDSRRYNIITGEGRIVIPKEVTEYDEIVAIITADPQKYRLMQQR